MHQNLCHNFFCSCTDTSEEGGDTSGGDSSGGDSSGGDSSGGDSSGDKECKDIRKPERCNTLKEKGLCSKRWFAAARCAKTCDRCDEFLQCKDFAPAKRCARFVEKGRCEGKKEQEICPKSCGVCT